MLACRKRGPELPGPLPRQGPSCQSSDCPLVLRYPGLCPLPLLPSLGPGWPHYLRLVLCFCFSSNPLSKLKARRDKQGPGVGGKGGAAHLAPSRNGSVQASGRGWPLQAGAFLRSTPGVPCLLDEGPGLPAQALLLVAGSFLGTGQLVLLRPSPGNQVREGTHVTGFTPLSSTVHKWPWSKLA